MPYVQGMAKRIVEKWSRLVYNIKSNYDCEGEFEDEYRVLQKRLNKIRENRESSEIEEPKPSSAQRKDLMLNH